MDIGIVRLMATVAISDDVKKQPLLTKQPYYILPDKISYILDLFNVVCAKNK
jgi:hypothetical protein